MAEWEVHPGKSVPADTATATPNDSFGVAELRT